MKSGNLFQLTEQTVSRIKYIKLDKKASYMEKDIPFFAIDPSQYKAISFYSFGFYDSLTCIMPERVSHKEHFLISYPYERTANALKVEQWFGIFPLAEQKLYTSETSRKKEIEDPFFCDVTLQQELPFVGVILLSLSKSEKTFNQLLTEYIDLIEGLFSSSSVESNRYITEIYYSLNCADLCLAIRTDSLPFIHNINRSLNEIAEKASYDINTTVIFSVQNETDSKRLKELSPVNKGVSFIVRSTGKYGETHMSYGVNGIGKYVTKLSFEQYVEFIPSILRYKLHNDDAGINPFVRGICHEREWFNEDNREINTPFDTNSKKLQPLIPEWTQDIVHLIDTIQNQAYNLFQHCHNTLTYKERFWNEFYMVRDLFFTYSDLWYQDASESGLIFFAQLWIALKGLENMMKQSLDFCNSKNQKSLEKSIQKLLDANHSIVCDLNGYNKQFQFLNQDSVNYPSYEIQSKVNSQKYMAAYCSFLHRLFVIYYDSKDPCEKIVQKFPIALVDINSRKIIANIFFPYLYTKNTKEGNSYNRSIFSVHFPSSEYFSNVWSSIPLLMHEACHTQHYGKSSDRNSAVVYSIDKFFATFLVRKMVKTVNNGIVIGTSSLLLNQMEDLVYQSLVSSREELSPFLEDDLTFYETVQCCRQFYHNIFDTEDKVKEITYSGLLDFGKNIQEDVERILKTLEFSRLCYIFVSDSNYPKSLYYFINTLYLEFHEKFYQQHKEKYDTEFSVALEDEISNIKNNEEASNSDPDLILLELSLYQFERYVKKDYSAIFNRNMKDCIYIAFQIVLIAGMNAIFSKYSENFSKMISEQSQHERYLKDLRIVYLNHIIPEIDTENNISSFNKTLKEAYQHFIEDQKSTWSNICTADSLLYNQNLMEAMLSEYYEFFLSVNNVVNFMVSDRFILYKNAISGEKDISYFKTFIKHVHRNCYDAIKNMESKDEEFKAIFTNSNRKQLSQLGLLTEDTRIIESVFSAFFSQCHDSFVDNEIHDRSTLFQEVYADCGMCSAIGFNPFGYCMFTMSVHSIVNDETSTNSDANFLVDRISSILRIYFASEKNGINEFHFFIEELMNKEMLLSMCQMLTSIQPSLDIELISQRIEQFNINYGSLSNPKDIKIICDDLGFWMEEIVSCLMIIMESEFNNATYDNSAEKDKISLGLV